MYISEVKSIIRRERGSFLHRREFETLAEALEWARDLASRIIEGGFWSDDEIIMEHRSIDGVLTSLFTASTDISDRVSQSFSSIV